MTEVKQDWTMLECLEAVEAKNVMIEVEHLKQKAIPKPTLPGRGRR